MRKQKTKNHANRELLFLLLVVFGMALFLYRSFIFGNNLYLYGDLNDDTFQSYLPSYQLIVNMIKSGNFSLYSTAFGLGTNILTMQMFAFDPFALPVYLSGLLFGLQAMAPALVYAQVLRIVAAALACFFFLRPFSLSPFSRGLACLTYAFSAYMVGIIGQHYVFATAPVFIALVLGLVERCKNGRWPVAILAITVGVLGIWSFYFCYMVLLAAGIYAVLRWLQRTEKLSIKGFFGYFLPLIIGVGLGLALSGAIFVPAAMNLTLTSERVGESSLLASALESLRFMPPLTSKSIFLRLFSEQLQGTANHWQGGQTANHHAFFVAHIACSVLLPVALPQYIAGIVAKLRQRPTRALIVTIIFVVLVVLSFFLEITGMIFNVFAGVMMRYTFVLLPACAFLIAWVTHQALIQRKFYRLVGWGTALVCVGAIAWGCEWAQPGAAASGVAAILGIVLSTLLLQALASVARRPTAATEPQTGAETESTVSIASPLGAAQPLHSRGKQWIAAGLALVAVVGLLVDDNISLVINRRVFSKQGYQETYYSDAAVEQVIEDYSLRGDSFRRMDRNAANTSVPLFTYSNISYYRSISFYISVINKHLQAFRSDFAGTDLEYIASGYGRGQMGLPMDPTLADVLGLKYVISDYQTQDPSWTLTDDTDGRYVYEKANLDTAGLLYTSWCTPAAFEEMDASRQQALLAHTALVEEGRPQDIPLAEDIPMDPLDDAILWDSLISEGGQATHTEAGSLLMVSDGTEEIVLAKVWLDTTGFLQEKQQRFVTIDSEIFYLDGVSLFFDTGSAQVPATAMGGGQIGLRQEKIGASHVFRMPADTQALIIKYSGQASVQIDGLSLHVSAGQAYTNDGVTLSNPGMAGTIVGQVETETPGILVVPLCYEAGWEATLDGEPVALLRAQRAFLAIEVPAGTHEIQLQYKTPGLLPGIVFSVAGLGGLVLYLLLKRKKLLVKHLYGGADDEHPAK